MLANLRIAAVMLGLVIFIQGTFAEEFIYGDSWGKAGYTLNTQTKSNVTVNYSIGSFSLENVMINGESMVDVQFKRRPGRQKPTDRSSGVGRYPFASDDDRCNLGSTGNIAAHLRHGMGD